MDPSQLQHIESLCHSLYLGTSASDRALAQQQLLTLSSSLEYLPQCQEILNHSTQSYALLLASNSIEILITTYWNNLTISQRMELKNYFLNYLVMNSYQLDDYVIASLIKLLCRIIKLGWFDLPIGSGAPNSAGGSGNAAGSGPYAEILEDITRFINHENINYNIIGIKILVTLVGEMNVPITGKTLTQHRKVAVSFRDNLLYSIFTIGMTSLTQVQSQGAGGGAATTNDLNKFCNVSLTLIIGCLSFDFIGTNPEESPEDVGTVQVPSSWRPIVQDTTTIELLFNIYRTNSPPRSSQAMEAIVQLSSVRRSLFTTEKERQVFLDYLMNQIHEIMASKHGLDEEENYHEFCRLLGRLKASYQLSELVKTRGFADWLALASDFTTKSLLNWQYSMNSIHYLLALWSRLVAALPYLRPDAAASSGSSTAAAENQMYSNVLKQCVMAVIEAYIQTMLSSVEVIVDSDGEIDDPLEDEGTLKEQMEKLPTLVRLQYDTIAQFLLSVLQSDLEVYENIMRQLGNQPVEALPMETQRQVRILDGRLTWMTHIIAAVIGSQPNSSVTVSAESRNDQLFDGQLSRGVFMLIQMVDYRLDATSGGGKCSEHLEIAFLRFFQAFKRSYLMDAGSMGSPLGIGMGGMQSSQSIPGGEAAHPLLSLALSYVGDQTMSNESFSIFDTMGLGDTTSIMNIMVSKICSNIRHWNRSHSLLDITLDLFVDLISTYSSSKTLLSLDMIQFMIHNHSPLSVTVQGRGDPANQSSFPFLSYDNDNKYRIAFYTALSRLVFTAAEDLNNSFDLFISPKLSVINQLLSLSESDLSSSAARVAIICICRDFRGITTATTSKRTYNLLFDVLYPDFFSLLKNATSVWCADPPVMTAILKFLQVLFPPSCPYLPVGVRLQ
jgi:exportin-7